MNGSGMPAAKHGIAELEPGVRLHYVVTGGGSRTMVLLHGYPQTWWEWRHVLGPLVRAGWRVITPDYRGAGGSSKPPTGYDKRTMASDLYKLLRDHLEIAGPITLVGHDIGMMVAYAFASEYPKMVDRLVLMEAPLPGTLAYDTSVASIKVSNVPMWHFFFHNAQNNLAESLTSGRERMYLQHFYERLAFDQDAITEADLDLYASHYSAAGAMRAGFELYRAFDRDAEDNKALLKKNGRLTMPVLALGGTSSFYLPIAKVMLAEVAKHVTVAGIPDCGHWIAEENPKAFLSELLSFCSQGSR